MNITLTERELVNVFRGRLRKHGLQLKYTPGGKTWRPFVPFGVLTSEGESVRFFTSLDELALYFDFLNEEVKHA